MARPKKTDAERRDEGLRVRLTTAEQAEIEDRAAGLGLTASEFMRRRSLDYALPLATAEQRQQAAAAVAFIRLGNNMNQIARHLNSGSEPSEVEAELHDLLSRISAELDRFYGPGRH